LFCRRCSYSPFTFNVDFRSRSISRSRDLSRRLCRTSCKRFFSVSLFFSFLLVMWRIGFLGRLWLFCGIGGSHTVQPLTHLWGSQQQPCRLRRRIRHYGNIPRIGACHMERNRHIFLGKLLDTMGASFSQHYDVFTLPPSVFCGSRSSILFQSLLGRFCRSLFTVLLLACPILLAEQLLRRLPPLGRMDKAVLLRNCFRWS